MYGAGKDSCENGNCAVWLSQLHSYARMPEAVSDCFPEAPDDCLDCPGLITAACNAGAHDELLDMPGHSTLVAAREALQMNRSANLAIVARVLGATVGEVVQARSRDVSTIGRLLHYGCQGVMTSLEFRPPKRLPRLLPRLRGKVAEVVWCGSSLPFADFVAGRESAEKPAWRYRKVIKSRGKPTA